MLGKVAHNGTARDGAGVPFGVETVHHVVDVGIGGVRVRGTHGCARGFHERGALLGAEEQLVVRLVLPRRRTFSASDALDERRALLALDAHAVGFDGFLHLRADAPHGVEVAHRVLRHESDAPASDLFELLGAGVRDVLALQADAAAGDAAGAGQQADDGHG